MAQQQKKLTRKEKIEQQKSQSQEKQVEKKSSGKSAGLKWMLSLIIAALAFALYANTLGHNYVLDDWSVIKENRLTMRGWDAFPEILKRSFRFGYITTQDELYRPLPKATFAMEWGIAPDNPKLPHFDNILIYALTGVLLFLTLRKYLKGDVVIPFITAILFIAHPIHTEAVANIKSRDEVMSLFFALGAMSCLYEWLRKDKITWLLAAVVSYFFSICS